MEIPCGSHSQVLAWREHSVSSRSSSKACGTQWWCGHGVPKSLTGAGGSPDLQPSFPGDLKVLGGEEMNSSVLSKEVDSALGHSWVMVALMKGCLEWPWPGVLRLDGGGGGQRTWDFSLMEIRHWKG